ncbi:MAG: protein-L-isoaspartate(D-aspartate) O-methyltransferase [Haliea sp.]|nr:protein-L-isoaspartate(D-aspartate) O-methyltransferase [Haliea sp.]
MLNAVRASVAESADYTGIAKLSDAVMDALGAVPREAFVPPAYRHQAYRNTPLPIAAGQTISQPLIVALMTEMLEPEPGDVMLEVGTGSGYQAAVLAQLVKHVYSIEIVEELADTARDALQQLHYDNITVRAGDGYAGWPEHAPFDGIIVTAAADEIPPPLLQQLKPGGKLVIPVGEHLGYQELLVVEVDSNGKVSKRSKLPVRFVPLTRSPSVARSAERRQWSDREEPPTRNWISGHISGWGFLSGTAPNKNQVTFGESAKRRSRRQTKHPEKRDQTAQRALRCPTDMPNPKCGPISNFGLGMSVGHRVEHRISQGIENQSAERCTMQWLIGTPTPKLDIGPYFGLGVPISHGVVTSNLSPFEPRPTLFPLRRKPFL